MIDDLDPVTRRVLYRFLSRNETKGRHMATEEEFLLEIVDLLRDAYEEDIKEQDAIPGEDESVVNRHFQKAAKEAAEKHKEGRGYRQLCCVETFALGLVMASRIRRHYTHAPWFKITPLARMLHVHGVVRT